MNKWKKKIITAGLCACMTTMTLSGCAPKADAAIATLDGTPVEYGVASFMVRYSQAQMQTMYGSYLGDDYWTSYGESTRDSMMESLEEMLVLEQHMDEYGVTITEEEKGKITEAAKAFMADNDSSVTKAMGVNQSTVERALTLYTVQTKMYEAVIEDVDTNVTDEEAAQKTIQYAVFSTSGGMDEEGNAIELPDEEKEIIKEEAQQVLDQVKEGEDLDSALQSIDEEKTSSTTSYGDENGSISDEVKAAADKLSDGEYTEELVETEDGYYIISMVSTFDEEATESQKDTIVSQRQNDKYTEVCDEWKEGAAFEQDAKVVEKITFKDVYEIKIPETEEPEEIEELEETDAEVTEAEDAEETEVLEEVEETEAE